MSAAGYFFEQLMGPRSLLVSGALPLLLGMAFAHTQRGAWSWPVAIVAFVAAICGVQAGMILDDLADHEGDAANSGRVDGLSGGGRGLTDGAVSRRTLWTVGVVVVALAGCAATAIAVVRPATIPVAVTALLVAILYSVGFRLVKRGLGDLVAFLAFGPLPIMYGYVAMAGTFDTVAFALAAGFGAFTVVGCAGMHLLDLDADASVAKRTLAVRVGRRRTVALMASAHVLGMVTLSALVLSGFVTAGVLVLATVLLPGVAASLWHMSTGGRSGEVNGETGLLVANTVLHLGAVIALVAGVPGAVALVAVVAALTAVTVVMQVHVRGRHERTTGEAGGSVETAEVNTVAERRSARVKPRSRKSVGDTRIPLLMHGVELPGEQRHQTHIDLDVRPGEIVAIDAPESVCDALQRVTRGDAAPASGQVLFMGRDLTTFRRRELENLRQRFLGVVTALPYVDNTVDVRGNLEYVLLLRGLDSAEIRDSIEDAVSGISLRDKLDRRFTELTLSETRWFVLLRGLLMRPQLLLIEAGAIDTSSELAERAAAHVRYHVQGTETGVLWTTTSVRAACAADRMFIYTMGNLVDADDQNGNTPYRLER